MSGGGKGGAQTVGYRYFFGIHAGIGRGPMDQLREIRVGGKLAWQGDLTASGSSTIDSAELFGGETKEGGVQGEFRLMMGEPDQTMWPPLAAMIAPTVATGYRRMVTLFFDGLIAALNPYPKPWSFRMRRAVKGWDGEVLRPDLAVITLVGPDAPGVVYEELTYTTMMEVPYQGSYYNFLVGVGEAHIAATNATHDACVIANGGGFMCDGRFPFYNVEQRSDFGGQYRLAYGSTNSEWGGSGVVTNYTPWADLGDPIPFTAPVPAGGTFVSVESVTRLDLNPPEEVFYTAVGDQVLIPEPSLRGKPIAVTVKYRPMLPPAFMEPDRTIKAMNPAHIVFECLTNREWGRGLDRSVINVASFEAAAETLFAEGFGMCIRWSRRDSIDSFIQEILDTCGAALYMDRTAALMTFKLIRKDYDRETLPLFDTSNGILTITNSTVNTSTVVINEVIVKYRETVFNEDRSVNVQNLASLQSTGGVFNTMTKTYKGIPTSGLARRVGQRDLRANSEGLRRFTITMDRRGSDLVPGQVIRIQDVARDIPDTVVRVATAKEGGGVAGTIQLLVIQDVFSFPAASFVADQPNTWQPPNFAPCLGEHEVFEAPYFMLARTMSPADFAYVDNGSAYTMAVAEQAKSSNLGFDLAVRPEEPTAEDWPLEGEAAYCGFDPADAPIP